MPTNDEIAESLWGGELAPRQQNPNEATARAALSLLAPHIANPDFWKEPAPPSMEPNAAGKVPEVKDPRVAGVLSDVAQTASNMFPFGGPAEGATALATKAIFAGPMALTADLKALAKAKTMAGELGPGRGLQPSYSPNQIWKESGWFQGADDKWRFEIPDDKSSVTFRGRDSLKKGEQVPLPKFLTHDKLYEAYPNLRNVVVDREVPEGYGGVSRGGSIGIDPATAFERNNRSIALHEAQHEVQRPEGFMVGQGPRRVADHTEHLERLEDANTLMKLMKDKVKGRDLSSVFKLPIDDYLNALDEAHGQFAEFMGRPPQTQASLMMSDLYHRPDRDFGIKHLLDTRESLLRRQVERPKELEKAHKDYWNQASEVEARNVQKRMSLKPTDRQMIPPWSTEDVPRSLQTLDDLRPVIRTLLGR